MRQDLSSADDPVFRWSLSDPLEFGVHEAPLSNKSCLVTPSACVTLAPHCPASSASQTSQGRPTIRIPLLQRSACPCPVAQTHTLHSPPFLFSGLWQQKRCNVQKHLSGQKLVILAQLVQVAICCHPSQDAHCEACSPLWTYGLESFPSFRADCCWMDFTRFFRLILCFSSFAKEKSAIFCSSRQDLLSADVTGGYPCIGSMFIFSKTSLLALGSSALVSLARALHQLES